MKRKILLIVSTIILTSAIFFLILPMIMPFEEILPKEHRPIVYIEENTFFCQFFG